MATYSHSRISTFEQCKYKYKLQYIDKIKVEPSTTIEAFMGDLVHRTLEKLYDDLRFEKLNSKEELLAYYNELWQKEWTSNILIVKKNLTAENYRKMGEKYISMYYDHYYPFDQMRILGIETQDFLTLPDGNRYHIRIDKLGCIGDTYYVCDYKTNSRMKYQEEADSDRQLAMYSIWVKDKFKDAKKVVLLWHMLAFDKEVISERNDEELQKLLQDVMNKIEEIENCNEWPTNVTALCDYCVYKSICPSFKHEVELQQKSVIEFKEDDGVKLVDEYSYLDTLEKEIRTRKEEIKNKLIEFANKKGIDVVYGSNRKIKVKKINKIIYPNDKDGFMKLLKDKGIYDMVSIVSYSKLNLLILKNQIDPEIVSNVSFETDYRLFLSKKRNEEDL